jgi:hypothetical protein
VNRARSAVMPMAQYLPAVAVSVGQKRGLDQQSDRQSLGTLAGRCRIMHLVNYWLLYALTMRILQRPTYV